VVNSLFECVFDVLIGNSVAGVIVHQNGCHPLEFGDEGHHPRLRVGDLYVGAQPLGVPGRQFQVVFAPQIEDGFQTHTAVQMTMEVDEWDSGIDHGER
jgi:hypothetical protein